jgi:hypothetical protein
LADALPVNRPASPADTPQRREEALGQDRLTRSGQLTVGSLAN